MLAHPKMGLRKNGGASRRAFHRRARTPTDLPTENEHSKVTRNLGLLMAVSGSMYSITKCLARLRHSRGMENSPGFLDAEASPCSALLLL